jgi:hypothetical protein
MMLFKIAVVLLIVWLCGVLGLYQAGEIVHVLLLVGMLLMLMAFLKARDAAIDAARREPPAKS